MDILPAIDIRQGRVVRLATVPGTLDPVYATDPVEQARTFLSAGASWLHVVDLDRALDTGTNNDALLQQIGRLPGARMQVGGLLQTTGALSAALDLGAARAVVATAAAADPELLDAIVRALEPASLAVAIDTRNAMPASRRGPIAGGLTPAMMAKRAVDLGVPNVIYRDLGSDGSLTGAPIRAAAALISASPRVIVAGGIGSLDDLRAAAHAGLFGVIVGRALYENRFSLQQALACSG